MRPRTTASDTESATDKPNPVRLPSLAGVRVPMAIVVFAVHAFWLAGLFRDARLLPIFQLLLLPSTASMSVFFALSGFVLTWSARPTDRARQFWRRRYARIFSDHLVAWPLAAALVGVFGLGVVLTGKTGYPTLSELLTSLTLVHVWVPRASYFSAINPVTWSLACECFFYLLFPVLLPLIRRIPVDRLWQAAVGCVLVSLSIPCLAMSMTGPPAYGWIGLPEVQVWFGYVFPVIRLPEFVFGMLLARIVANGRWRPLRWYWLLPFSLLMLASTMVLPLVFAIGPYYALPAGLIVGQVAYRDFSGQSSILRAKPMIYWGDRTYAFYISHYVVIMYVRQLIIGPTETFSTPVAFGLVLLVLLPAAGATSWLMYRFIERPVVTRFGRSQRTVPT